MRWGLISLAVLFPVLGSAQEDATGRLTVELNSVETVDTACQISFVVQNGHETPIDQAVFEAVLFDRNGRVDRLTLFDFGDLPAARPRVRQFMVPDLTCDALGQVLINGAATCDVAGTHTPICVDSLHLKSRIDIEVSG